MVSENVYTLRISQDNTIVNTSQDCSPKIPGGVKKHWSMITALTLIFRYAKMI
jgi:hypothetical protein